jgi:hypothetical protein
MKRAIILCLSILLLIVPVTQQAYAAGREVLLGTVYKDTAFAVPKLSSDKPRIFPDVVLLRGSLQIDPEVSYTPKRYQSPQNVIDNYPFRWRIVRDIFWGNGTAGARRSGMDVKRIPFADLPLVDPSNPKRKVQYKAKFPNDEFYEMGYEKALTWQASAVSSSQVSRFLSSHAALLC